MANGEAEACTVGSEGDGVLDEVARINSKLAGEKDDEAVLESLRQLQAVPMTFQVLEATKIGRAVNALRKNAPSDPARELAAALFGRWKALAEEHFRNSRRSQPPVVTSAAPTTDVSAKELAPAAASSESTPKAVDDKSARCSVPIKAKPTTAAAPRGSSACRRKEEVPTSSGDTATAKKQIRSTQPSGATEKKAERPPAAIRQRAAMAAAPKPAPASSSKPSGSSGKEASPPAAARPNKIPSVAKPAASLANKAKLPTGEPPKPSGGSSVRKRKEAPASIDEAGLAMVKRRLQEGYKEAAAIKEKRRIQVISEPGTVARGPFVVRRREARCSAAVGAGKQAPVPPRSRMFRAS